MYKNHPLGGHKFLHLFCSVISGVLKCGILIWLRYIMVKGRPGKALQNNFRKAEEIVRLRSDGQSDGKSYWAPLENAKAKTKGLLCWVTLIYKQSSIWKAFSRSIYLSHISHSWAWVCEVQSVAKPQYRLFNYTLYMLTTHAHKAIITSYNSRLSSSSRPDLCESRRGQPNTHLKRPVRVLRFP